MLSLVVDEPFLKADTFSVDEEGKTDCPEMVSFHAGNAARYGELIKFTAT